MKSRTVFALLWSAIAGMSSPAFAAPAAPLAARLSETGLYQPGSTTVVRPGVLAFSPQYPLWSDGARKRRWIALPPGASIDATQRRRLGVPASGPGCGRSSATAAGSRPG